MATIQELQAELAQINAATTAIYAGGQEYTIADGATKRSLRRADLNWLLRRKSELEVSIARLGGGGVSFGVAVDSPGGIY